MPNNADAKKGGKQGKTNGAPALANIQFINVNLNESHKTLYKTWIDSDPDIFSLMDDITMSGYKITGSYDEKGQCHLATVTNRNGQPEFLNHCFNLRARTMGEAFARVLWLHFILCEGDWNEIASPSSIGDIW